MGYRTWTSQEILVLMKQAYEQNGKRLKGMFNLNQLENNLSLAHQLKRSPEAIRYCWYNMRIWKSGKLYNHFNLSIACDAAYIDLKTSIKGKKPVDNLENIGDLPKLYAESLQRIVKLEERFNELYYKLYNAEVLNDNGY